MGLGEEHFGDFPMCAEDSVSILEVESTASHQATEKDKNAGSL
jgi:hypothetical protein